MDKDRQMYQLHKKGYEEIVKAISNTELKIEIEVNNATVTNTEITDEEENS